MSQVDPVVIGHYETIVLYARVIASFVEKGLDYTNGKLVVKNMVNTSFEGFQGSLIYIGSDGQRDKSYKIQYYDNIADAFTVRFRKKTE